MKIIYSGFDTITFAVQGALKPDSLKRIRLAKEEAVKEDQEKLISFSGFSESAFIKPHGQKGGYAFVLDMGYSAQIIRLKDNVSLTQWNGFVKIRAMSLALKGYEAAYRDALKALEAIGFDVKAISLNRADYAIDVLTPFPITLDPNCVVRHSRSKIKTHLEPLTFMSQSNRVQSITIGKMPNRQIIIYDKLAEVIVKRNYAWFKIWGLDRNADDINITRVEIRAGKTALKALNITSFEAFESRIGTALKRFISATRYVEVDGIDSNVSRRALHPLWKCITHHLENGFSSDPSNIDPDEITEIRKEVKALEYQKQILGNCMGYALCMDIEFEHIGDVINSIKDELDDMMRDGSAQNEIYGKKYIQAKDRLRF